MWHAALLLDRRSLIPWFVPGTGDTESESTHPQDVTEVREESQADTAMTPGCKGGDKMLWGYVTGDGPAVRNALNFQDRG